MSNVKIPEEWLEKADFLIRDAERHFEEGVYWIVCFESQQSVELYLKGLLVGATGLHPYTHDLSELLDSLKGIGLNPPEELYVLGDALTPHYTLARYPGRKPIKYSKETAKRCLEYARRIIKWVKEKASQKGL